MNETSSIQNSISKKQFINFKLRQSPKKSWSLINGDDFSINISYLVSKLVAKLFQLSLDGCNLKVGMKSFYNFNNLIFILYVINKRPVKARQTFLWYNLSLILVFHYFFSWKLSSESGHFLSQWFLQIRSDKFYMQNQVLPYFQDTFKPFYLTIKTFTCILVLFGAVVT